MSVALLSFVTQKPTAEFISAQCYRWAGGSQRPDTWDTGGGMDFLLDRKPHQVREGSGSRASFFDSPSPEQLWDFSGEQMGRFRLIEPDKVPMCG